LAVAIQPEIGGGQRRIEGSRGKDVIGADKVANRLVEQLNVMVVLRTSRMKHLEMSHA
jgi:hypothetical protein